MERFIPAREAALKALHRIEVEQGYSNIVLDEIFSNMPVKDVDKPLVTEIVYGVITRKLTIDYIIDRHSKIKASKISSWIRNILRIGLYQLLFLDRIPASAACNESVKLARRYGHQASAGFVNAILRKTVLLESELEDLKGFDDIKRVSVEQSHPEWLVEKWVGQFGTDFTDALCKANNIRPHIAIRVNTLKTTKEKLEEMLKKEDFEVTGSRFVPSALVLKQGNPINMLYEGGFYTVQDEAAMLVSEILDPKPGEVVADLCAAPGGKTTHIAQLMNNRGKIHARDIHPHRLELVEKAAKRLGVDIIETRLHNAEVLDEAIVGKCDKVLVDAPCSGFGVIRRKPEIKWRRKKEDLKELIEIQKRILENAGNYLKSGGRLVYSTCTLNYDENEKIVENFINNKKKFVLESIDVKEYDIKEREKGYIYLFPHIHGTDGFFIACLKKL